MKQFSLLGLLAPVALLPLASAYINAPLVPSSFQYTHGLIKDGEMVHLYPGWNDTLVNATTTQILVPKAGSKLSRCRVQVRYGNPGEVFETKNEIVSQVSRISNAERVIILMEDSLNITRDSNPIFTPEPIPELYRHEYVTAHLEPEDLNTIEADSMTARIYPGWSTKLTQRIDQVMISGLNSIPTKQKVRIEPGWIQISATNPRDFASAVYARVKLPNGGSDSVTIFMESDSNGRWPYNPHDRSGRHA